MTDLLDSPQLLGVDVQQLARAISLMALPRRRRIQALQAAR
jgi:hypothetical protein